MQLFTGTCLPLKITEIMYYVYKHMYYVEQVMLSLQRHNHPLNTKVVKKTAMKMTKSNETSKNAGKR